MSQDALLPEALDDPSRCPGFVGAAVAVSSSARSASEMTFLSQTRPHFSNSSVRRGSGTIMACRLNVFRRQSKPWGLQRERSRMKGNERYDMSLDRQGFRSLCEGGICAGPVSSERMTDAETALNVEFPDPFKAFLGEFGAVLCEGVEIYGLVDPARNDPPMWQDLVDVTTRLRAWGQAGTERKSLLPISDDGTGVYFYLDTEHSEPSDVWAIGSGVDQIVATGFYQFVVDFSKGRLSF